MQGTISEPLKKQDDRDGRTTLCWLKERGVEEYRGKMIREKDIDKRGIMLDPPILHIHYASATIVSSKGEYLAIAEICIARRLQKKTSEEYLEYDKNTF